MKATLKTLAAAASAACVLAVPAVAQDHQRTITWSGQVDDTTIVRIHADHVRTTSIHGRAPENVTTNVFEPLPDRPVHAWLTQVHGRGTVRLIQEPGPENDYTALVRLKDPQNGPEYYSFELRWRYNDDSNTNRPGEYHRHMDDDDDDDNR